MFVFASLHGVTCACTIDAESVVQNSDKLHFRTSSSIHGNSAVEFHASGFLALLVEYNGLTTLHQNT